MKNITFVLLLVIVASSIGHSASIQTIDRAEVQKSKADTGECDILISFGSYSSGIDRNVKEKIRAYIENSKDIKKALNWPWGKEGESDLCLKLSNINDTDKIFSALRAYIPVKSKHGNTTIKRMRTPNE